MGTSLLCETVTGHTMADLLAARDAATADMVELRLDGVADADIAAALRARRQPVVVTCRPTWEGGRFSGSEEERLGMLTQAAEAGADYVDVEWRAVAGTPGQSPMPGFGNLARRHASRVVLSSHDFEGVPADLHERARAMRGFGTAVIKIAVAAHRLTDTLTLLEIGREGRAIVIGMGNAGAPSRVLAARYGSPWTYAGNAVAPGQLPAARMTGEFGFRRITGRTRIFGVVSTNAMHSLSPAMHNAAFEAAGIDAVYVPLSAADFEDFLEYAEAMGIEGVSVTIPFKLDALRAAVGADELTRTVGAANTLRRVRRNEGKPATGGWEAANTDVDGFLAPLATRFPVPLEGARAAVLGAGGSARAVVAGLVSRGARVTVYARRVEQAQDVVSSFARAEGLALRLPDAGAWPPAAGSWDLLVNCTPLGGVGHRDESPLPDGPFTGRLVYDLTYGLEESPLLRAARGKGCLTLDGLPMLIAQAERQFEWWTGARPQAGVMRAAAERTTGRREPASPADAR